MEVSTKQERIAELAKQTPPMSFTSLNHFLDEGWFMEAFKRLKKDRAAGVDHESVSDYGENLEENIHDLIDRAKSGSYFAPPVKRVYIPKANSGEKRPIGIPTTEDKLLQRAVVMLLEPIYETDFLDCSYGFRPGRSPHDALARIRDVIMGMGGGWVLDVDVSKYFDNLDHTHLREFLRLRVSDGVIRKLIDKWLKAGVLSESGLSYQDKGTPQGGVISPLLSNIYLHYVLDSWIEEVVKPLLVGPCELVRFADDFVLIFKHRADAEKVFEVLPKRLSKYGLAMHPDKTRLVWFSPYGKDNPETFTFLNFTHYWGKSRKGRWVVKRKTSGKRFSKAVGDIHDWCRKNRHLKVKDQHRILSAKVRGHYNYFGIKGNYRSLARYLYEVCRKWRYWLNRRNRENRMPWERFVILLERYPLPKPRIMH